MQVGNYTVCQSGSKQILTGKSLINDSLIDLSSIVGHWCLMFVSHGGFAVCSTQHVSPHSPPIHPPPSVTINRQLSIYKYRSREIDQCASKTSATAAVEEGGGEGVATYEQKMTRKNIERGRALTVNIGYFLFSWLSPAPPPPVFTCQCHSICHHHPRNGHQSHPVVEDVFAPAAAVTSNVRPSAEIEKQPPMFLFLFNPNFKFHWIPRKQLKSSPLHHHFTIKSLSRSAFYQHQVSCCLVIHLHQRSRRREINLYTKTFTESLAYSLLHHMITHLFWASNRLPVIILITIPPRLTNNFVFLLLLRYTA